MNTKYQKISKLKLLLFMIVTSIFYVVSLPFDLVINDLRGSSFLLPLFILILSFIIYLFLPKTLNARFALFKNNYLRIIYKLFMIIQTIVIVVFASSFIQTYFNIQTSLLIFIVIFLISTFTISNSSITNIINTSIIFVILSLLFYIIPFTTNSNHHINYLETIDNNFHFHIIYCLLITSYIFDFITISFYQTSVTSALSKSDFLLYVVIVTSILGFILYESTTLVSYKYYTSLNNMSFFHWLSYKANKFINSYDIIVFFIMITSVFFKVSYNFHFIASSSKNTFFSSKYFTFFIILIISAFLYYSRTYYSMYNMILNIVNFIFSISIVVITTIILRKTEVIK